MAAKTRSPQERRAAAKERRARRAEVEDPAVVMEAAAAFLAVRPRSTQETSRRLRHLGYPGQLTDSVVARLVEMGYLDDAEFARAWVESRDRARPRGASALRRELQLKGIDADTIASTLERRDERMRAEGTVDAGSSGTPGSADESAAARLLQRRSASLARETDPRKRRQKAYGLLARHGFGPDICQRLAATVDDPADDVMDGATGV